MTRQNTFFSRLAAGIALSLLLHLVIFWFLSTLLRHGKTETFGQSRPRFLSVYLASPSKQDTGRQQAQSTTLLRPHVSAKSAAKIQSAVSKVVSAAKVIVPDAPALESPPAFSEATAAAQPKETGQNGISLQLETTPAPNTVPSKSAGIAANPRRRSIFGFSSPKVIIDVPGEGVHPPQNYQGELAYRQAMEARAMQAREMMMRDLNMRFHQAVYERIRQRGVLEGQCIVAQEVASSLRCEPDDFKERFGDEEILAMLNGLHGANPNIRGFSVMMKDNQPFVEVLHDDMRSR